MNDVSKAQSSDRGGTLKSRPHFHQSTLPFKRRKSIFEACYPDFKENRLCQGWLPEKRGQEIVSGARVVLAEQCLPVLVPCMRARLSLSIPAMSLLPTRMTEWEVSSHHLLTALTHWSVLILRYRRPWAPQFAHSLLPFILAVRFSTQHSIVSAWSQLTVIVLGH